MCQFSVAPMSKSGGEDGPGSSREFKEAGQMTLFAYAQKDETPGSPPG